MECRRSFLKKGLAGALVLSVPPTLSGCSLGHLRPEADFVPRPVRKACVLWYSQTGFTRKSGEVMAETLRNQGIEVVSGDIRSVDKSVVGGADLVVVGSPVFYYDTPGFVKRWIATLPDLKGTPVAAYVTFGGPEGNQHNAAFSILESLTARNGVAVGMQSFLSMSTFPLSWPDDRDTLQRKLSQFQNSHIQIQEYGRTVVKRVETGDTEAYHRKLTLREISTGFSPIWWTKRAIKHHFIDAEKCIQCGTCVEKCPVDAIDPLQANVNTETCVLCFGCINNCPAQAVQMESGDKPLVGYLALMQQLNLAPSFLKGDRKGA